MNKIVSVPSGPQPQKSPASVPITSLREAIEVLNAQDSLSTEDLFKTLLVYNRTDGGWFFPTHRDPQFLTEAIRKNSSQSPVSVETQKKYLCGYL